MKSLGESLKLKYNAAVSKYVKKRLYMNTYINLSDNTHMEIENCKRILEYNDVFVKIRTSTLIIGIWGQDLRLSDYNTDGIVVDGKFTSVEFEKIERKNDDV